MIELLYFTDGGALMIDIVIRFQRHGVIMPDLWTFENLRVVWFS